MKTVKYLLAAVVFSVILSGSCSAQSMANNADTVSVSDFVFYKTGMQKLCIVGYYQGTATTSGQFSCSRARAPYISSCCFDA